MAIKAAKGKLPYFASMTAYGSAPITAALQSSNLELLPVELHHALASAALPQHHKDPFDRVMIAQALAENMVLISSDGTFARYAGLRIMRA